MYPYVAKARKFAAIHGRSAAVWHLWQKPATSDEHFSSSDVQHIYKGGLQDSVFRMMFNYTYLGTEINLADSLDYPKIAVSDRIAWAFRKRYIMVGCCTFSGVPTSVQMRVHISMCPIQSPVSYLHEWARSPARYFTIFHV